MRPADSDFDLRAVKGLSLDELAYRRMQLRERIEHLSHVYPETSARRIKALKRKEQLLAFYFGRLRELEKKELSRSFLNIFAELVAEVLPKEQYEQLRFKALEKARAAAHRREREKAELEAFDGETHK